MLSLQSQLCTREHSFRTWKKKKVSVFVIGAGFIFYAFHPSYASAASLPMQITVNVERTGPSERPQPSDTAKHSRESEADRETVESGQAAREWRPGKRDEGKPKSKGGPKKKKKKSLRPRREQPKGEMQIILQPKFTFWKNVNPLIISANVQDEVQTIYFFFFFIYLKQMLWIFIVIFCLSYLLYKICRKKTKLNSSNQTKWQRIV